MQGKNSSRLTPLASWIGRELLPPVTRWVVTERLPVEARALQARARRALEIGEIDGFTNRLIMMQTGAIVRWCLAEVAGQISAWIEPGGKTYRLPYGGHWNWVKENAQYLVAQGFASASDTSKPGATSNAMMLKGWVRYSAGQVMCGPVPDEAQLQAVQQIVADAPAVPESVLDLQFLVAGVHMKVPVEQALSEGLAKIVAMQEPQSQEVGEVPLSPHQVKKADAGGGTDGPFQQGDGQDTPNTFMEQIEDGSTAPIERAYQFMKQDWNPEVWEGKTFEGLWSKNYPGKSQPGAQSDLPASGTGPGQQFASAARVVVTAARNQAAREDALLRRAEISDPSDTDGQHDQINEDSMATHTLDPQSQFNKKQKGLGAPTQELKTNLGSIKERWLNRRSDKGVENQIIQMEKGHLEPDQIVKELREEGIPPRVISETYENREKNLFKVVEVGS